MNQAWGIGAGILAGAFWGLPFLVPQVLSQFSSTQVAFGRFLFFGIFSLLSLPKVLQLWKSISNELRWKLWRLSASGFWLYSLLLFWSIQHADGVIASLVIGMIPLSVTLFSGVRLTRSLIAGLVLIFWGLLFLFLDRWEDMRPLSPWALLTLFVCLGLWSSYALQNSRLLQKNPNIRPWDLASFMGLSSFIVVSFWALASGEATSLLHHPQLEKYFWWCLALGAGASWASNILWNLCSSIVPASIAGPLIVSETLFGLLLSYLYESRWPRTKESLAIFFLVLGVLISVITQQSSNTKKNLHS